MNGKKSFVGFVLFVVVFSSTFAATKNKDLKWRNLKPLQTIDSENVISVANSSEKKNGLFIAKISEEKQMAIFFTPEEGKYGYPLANKNNKRLLLAKLDPKTQMVGDGICVEVPEDWKSVISIANGFFVVPSYDSKQGNSLVWIDEKNWTFKTSNPQKYVFARGIIDWVNAPTSSDFYYYFWDLNTKKLCIFISDSGFVKMTGYEVNNPIFVDFSKQLGVTGIPYIICKDSVAEDSTTSKSNSGMYRCFAGGIDALPTE